MKKDSDNNDASTGNRFIRLITNAKDSSIELGRKAVTGVKTITGVQGYMARLDAKELKEEADAIVEKVEKQSSDILEDVNSVLQELCNYREEALNNTVFVFIEYCSRIGKKVNIKDYVLPSSFAVKQERIDPLPPVEMKPLEAAKVAAEGIGAGAAVAIGTPKVIKQGVEKFGKVGDKRIKDLHGAAKQNAVMANIGGGAIKAGGGGMAKGAKNLGRISKVFTVVVIIATFGTEISAYFTSEKTAAIEHLEQVKCWAEKTKAGYKIIEGLKKQIKEIQTETEFLAEKTKVELKKLESFVDCFDKDDDAQLQVLERCFILCKSMGKLATIPIYAGNGQINDDIKIEIASSKNLRNHMA